MRMTWFPFCLAIMTVGFSNLPCFGQEASVVSVGAFEGSSDIGTVQHTGSATFDPEESKYSITGGGANVWGEIDAFHYLYKKVEGDISIAADIALEGPDGDPHRKAFLMIRQSLDANSIYADAVIHGNGLASIQYRDAIGERTREIQSNLSNPARIRLEKVGDYVSMSIGGEAGEMQPAGGAFRIQFTEPFFIGLGVCAHNNDTTETASFKNVEIKPITAAVAGGRNQPIESTLEVVPISSGDRRVVYHRIGTRRFEAPNWSADNQLIFNDGGSLYSIPADGSEPPKQINTGDLNRLNNDHGISFDGKLLAISDGTRPGGSRIYVLPIEGGEPKLVTEAAPSYWHGWGTDNKTVAYCAERNGNYDIYTMSIDGGEETRLTTTEGLDDGPEYSPDGKYIYFNSVRSGSMQIWRMKPDGSDQEQVTPEDEYNNWFAHPSPDGQWIVFISYNQSDVEPGDHPANKDVMLRMMPTEGGEIQVLAKLFGGQGTNNVPSWSPDSRSLAFVSYRLVPQEDE